MRIKYRVYYRRDNTAYEEVSVWLDKNLQQSGIEDKIRKITNLMAVISEDFLSRNPDKLEEIVQAIECDGSEHQLE